MDLDRAIKLAMDGKALLFVGAGFSADGINLDNKPFPVASDFAKEICAEMGKTANDNLSLVSDMYMSNPNFGVSAMIRKLNRAYKLKALGSHEKNYQAILSIPWKRIYTTNYDDLCEKALSSLGRVAIPKTLSDDVGSCTSDLTVLHLNGYIDRLSPDALQNEFKLSSKSYLVEDFQKSPWLNLFRAELNAAQAIVFIGVSFDYDIDLQRIIVNSDAHRNKIVFIDRILKEGEDIQMHNYYKEQFGSVYNIGMVGFSEKIEEVGKVYTPHTEPMVYTSFSKVESSSLDPQVLSSQDSRDLLRFGKIRSELIPYSQNNNKYIFCREAEDRLIHLLKDANGYDCIVLTSELANGKTCMIQHTAYFLQDEGACYIFKEFNDTTIDEFYEIISSPGKKYIFIENYNFQYQALKLFHQFNLQANQVKIVLSARNAIYETTSYKIPKYTGLDDNSIIELNIDSLTDGDIDKLVELLNYAGIWDKFRNKNSLQKRGMVKKLYNSQFYNLLLDLIKSEKVAEEIGKICDEISKNAIASKLLIGVCISNLINLDLSLSDLLSILQIQLSQAVKQDVHIRQLVNFRGDTIEIRSSVLCRFLIVQPQFVHKVKDVLLQMNQNAEACSNTNRISAMRNSLISSSNIGLIFPASEKSTQKYLVEYYNALKGLPEYSNNQFFWLQFAMVCMDIEDYQRAKDYLDISYEIIKTNKLSFDPYQIDTQKARFFLESTLCNNDFEHAFFSFEGANRLLIQVIRRGRGQNHLVFKQVIKYKNYYEVFGKQFTNSQRNKMINACKEFITVCSNYKLAGQHSNNQIRITDDAIESLNALKDCLIKDIAISMSED